MVDGFHQLAQRHVVHSNPAPHVFVDDLKNNFFRNLGWALKFSYDLSFDLAQTVIDLTETSPKTETDHHHEKLHVVPAESVRDLKSSRWNFSIASLNTEDYVQDFDHQTQRKVELNSPENKPKIALEKVAHRILDGPVAPEHGLVMIVGGVWEEQKMFCNDWISEAKWVELSPHQ